MTGWRYTRDADPTIEGWHKVKVLIESCLPDAPRTTDEWTALWKDGRWGNPVTRGVAWLSPIIYAWMPIGWK
mgnify:CR=1 FL=1